MTIMKDIGCVENGVNGKSGRRKKKGKLEKLWTRWEQSPGKNSKTLQDLMLALQFMLVTVLLQ